jgi:casein kinase 1 delta
MIIINNKYQIQSKIGNGSFGKVFLGIHLQNKNKIIMKTESLDTSYGLLKHETNILYFLSRHRCSNIPSVYWYGNTNSFTELGPQKCLVMTYFPGKSLDQLREKMTMQEKKQWMYSMIFLLEQIHQTGIIHRDIKPAHFILSENGKWNLIDFGLATFVSTEQIGREKEQDSSGSASITGTPNYVSLHIHQGFTPTKRDDLISLGYIFLELCLCGGESISLPWKNGGVSKEWYIERKDWRFLFSFISEIPFSNDEAFTILCNYFQECEQWTFESMLLYSKIKTFLL